MVKQQKSDGKYKKMLQYLEIKRERAIGMVMHDDSTMMF